MHASLWYNEDEGEFEMFEQVYEIVRRIPRGRVFTYGGVARMLGNPRLSRAVGYALCTAPGDVPCHRLVSRTGGLSAAFEPLGRETHRMLLEMEDVPFRGDGTVDLEQCLWDGVTD